MALRALKGWLRNIAIAALESRGYRVRFRGFGTDFSAIIEEASLRAGGEFFFLQIGGLDGVSDDPIHRYVKQYEWQGVIVEPQPQYFAKLQETYRGFPRVTFENTLVAEENGSRLFYRLTESSPEKYHGLASFDRSLITKHLPHEPDAESWIVEERFPALSLKSLLRKHQITHLDLLQVDTEGFDYDIIRQLNFEIMRPRIIHFEHVHLTAQKLRGCVDLLRSKGYTLLIEDMDITAYLRHFE